MPLPLTQVSRYATVEEGGFDGQASTSMPQAPASPAVHLAPMSGEELAGRPAPAGDEVPVRRRHGEQEPVVADPAFDQVRRAQEDRVAAAGAWPGVNSNVPQPGVLLTSTRR